MGQRPKYAVPGVAMDCQEPKSGQPDGMARLGRAFFAGTDRRPIYVDHVSASNSSDRRLPVVMVHGACHTGTCYLSTPDGREGWAGLFVRSGRDVYVIDWPGH